MLQLLQVLRSSRQQLKIGLGQVEILYSGTRVPITHGYPGTHYHNILGMPTVRKCHLNENNKQCQSVCLFLAHVCMRRVRKWRKLINDHDIVYKIGLARCGDNLLRIQASRVELYFICLEFFFIYTFYNYAPVICNPAPPHLRGWAGDSGANVEAMTFWVPLQYRVSAGLVVLRKYTLWNLLL